MIERRRCVGWDETAAHEYKRGSLVGDSPGTTKYRKQKTNRRERREGTAMCTEEFNGTLDGGKGAWEVTDRCSDPACASSLEHPASQDRPR